MPKFDNNLTVIGGGSAGLIAALIGATVKAKVTLVERGKMGGDCLNTGCVPSKTLIRSAKIAHYQRHGARYGLSDLTPDVDFPAVMDRVRQAVATIEPKDSMERYTQLGVDCIAGEARLVDPHTVEVDGRRLSARSIVLASGATPFVPPIPGLAEANPLTSDNLWDLESLPKRLLVMGGGPIGCELAQAFARLGAQVTLIDMADRLLPREDIDVSQFIEARFAEEGIDVRTQCKAIAVEGNSSGENAMTVETPQGKSTIDFDRVLVAVGRRAHTESLGLAELGIETHRNGTVVVDDYLRTSVPSVFACGDVAGPYQFTHMASHQAWYAAVNGMVGRFWKFKVNYSVVPWATYTDPEVARVGLSEEDARDQGIAVEVTTYPLDDLDRAIAEGATEGWVKVLTAPGKDKILGVTIVGAHAGELINEFVSAMTHGLGLKAIMGTIHIYPTFSEANKMAAGAWRRANAPTTILGWLPRLHALLR